MLFLYQLLFPLIAAGVLGKMLVAGRGATLREGLADLRQRLGLTDLPLGKGRVIWIHAASVGEVNSAAPLVARIAAEPSTPRIIFTTSTKAGRDRAAALPGVKLAALAPMDFFPALSAFLRRVNPEVLVLIETELWPMTLRLAQRRGVRLSIANGKVNARSFSRYRLLRLWLAPLLARVERAAAASEEDAERLRALGVPSAAITVAGNMKYDTPLPTPEELERARKLIQGLGWGEDPVWVAGSTWRGEEEILAEAHCRLRNRLPGARLILAPRHPERAEESAQILSARNLKFMRISELNDGKTVPQPLDCLLIDRLGLLGAFYGASSAAFVGGTLVQVGGHNLLEPPLLQRPVLFGPHTQKIQEPASALELSGGGFRVSDAETLCAGLFQLLSDSGRARQAGFLALRAASAFTGATERTLTHLLPLL